MTYTKVLPAASMLSEFYQTGMNGDCVETAMAVAVGIVKQTGANPQTILTITRSMQSEGIASSNGATSIDNAHAWLVQQHYPIEAFVGYSEPFNGDWLGMLRQYAGSNPIVLNVANAQALFDVETNTHDEVGVHYHGLAICGISPAGYIAVDGDNPQARERYQVYTRQTIEAAKPCGMIVLSMPPSATPQPATGGTPMPIPDGWKDDGSTLIAPNGVPVIHGFRNWLLGNQWFLQVAGNPLAPEYSVDALGMDPAHGAGVEQIFNGAALGYQQSNNWIGPLWIGAMANSLAAQLSDTQKQLQDVTTQLTQAQDAYNQLKAQVATQPSGNPDADTLYNAVLNAVNNGIIKHAQGGA